MIYKRINQYFMMENWRGFIKQKIFPELKSDCLWKQLIESIENDAVPFGIHLAIFNEPYLSYIFQGQKTIESRFSANKIAPYKDVYVNDIVLLKLSGGPVTGVCQISDIWHYRLDPKSWEGVKKEYTISLCAQDPNFWKKREKASFATLMKMKNIKTINPLKFEKTDRRGWAVLKQRSNSQELLHTKHTIIAISGKIGSGKSTLAKALSEKLSWPCSSFGFHVRKEAKRRGVSQDRNSLQIIGEELLKNPEQFCSDVLSCAFKASADHNIIIDGVRQTSILKALSLVKPKANIIAVYIDVSEEIRLNRLKKRNSHDYVDLIKIESHITETDVEKGLKSKADIIVDGGLPVLELVRKIVTRI